MKKLMYLILVVFLFSSCGKNEKKTEKLAQVTPEKTVENKMSEGYELLKTKCYACHNPNAKSHDEIIAPPFVAVKRRYSMAYPSRDAFVDAIVKWTSEPSKEKALMRGAVNQFNVMPKQAFKTEELQKIAIYLYDNDVEEPEWFAAHEKEMHPNGMRGKGRGRMNKKN